MTRRWLLAAAAAFGLAGTCVPAFGQHPASAADPAPSERIALQGAGATFPAPLYQKWIEVYTKAHPDVAIRYDVVGSGEGVKRFLAHSVDFGASDSALSDEEIGKVPAGATLVPVTAGILALAYNLPGVEGPLKLSRDVYIDLFLGKIRHWNDPRIQELNPDLKLPKQVITLVSRLDSSGTTYAMTHHLSAISEEWRKGPGTGTMVEWPSINMKAPGNEGVAGRIKRSWGSIGYVQFGFAKRLGLPMAHLQNQAGRYIEPSFESGRAAIAANTAQVVPANLRLFLPDPEGEDSYPIVSLTWLLLYDQYADARKSAALRDFVNWTLTEGQNYSVELGYIPLPAELVTLARAAVDRVR
jgi:phosphate transport system substrate-binding protein